MFGAISRHFRRAQRGEDLLKRRLRLIIEACEPRQLLSASSVLDELQVVPLIQPLASTNTTPVGYTPAQIAQAYGFSQITLAGGVQGTGAGQTIAIVDAYDDPYIASDLHVFDQTFGLVDPPKFTKVNQNGGTTMPQANAGWAQEIALDVEWAHAMAPQANILLVEASSATYGDLMAAVNYARNQVGVSVVSMSWGGGEFSGEKNYDSYFTTPAGHGGVTFIASAGDSGAAGIYPAVSPNVLAVGGTSLSLSSGSYLSESAWSASGGGYSQYESEPSFQSSAQTSGRRASPDVAFNANPSTGFAVYDSFAVSGRSGWFQIGGTSAGAPQWAALVAIANQGRALNGLPALSGAQSSLYSLPKSDFHDITSGSNGYAAKAGYDLVTGLGTPLANAVVAGLTGNSTATSTQAPATSTAAQPRVYEYIFFAGRWWRVGAAVATDDASNSGAGAESNAAFAATRLMNAGGAGTGMLASTAGSLVGPAAAPSDSLATLSAMTNPTTFMVDGSWNPDHWMSIAGLAADAHAELRSGGCAPLGNGLGAGVAGTGGTAAAMADLGVAAAIDQAVEYSGSGTIAPPSQSSAFEAGAGPTAAAFAPTSVDNCFADDQFVTEAPNAAGVNESFSQFAVDNLAVITAAALLAGYGSYFDSPATELLFVRRQKVALHRLHG